MCIFIKIFTEMTLVITVMLYIVYYTHTTTIENTSTIHVGSDALQRTSSANFITNFLHSHSLCSFFIRRFHSQPAAKVEARGLTDRHA